MAFPKIFPAVMPEEHANDNSLHKYIYASTSMGEVIYAIRIYLKLFGNLPNPDYGPSWSINSNISNLDIQIDITLYRKSIIIKEHDVFCIDFSINYGPETQNNDGVLLNLYFEVFVDTIMKNTKFRH